MKNIYNAPELKIITLAVEDVLSVSGGDDFSGTWGDEENGND